MPTSTKRSSIPYGLWPSPISPADVAKGTRRFGILQGDSDWIYWTEGRPEENGRNALMRCRPGSRVPEQLLAAPWSARSRVHEYGGGEFLAAGDVVYFVNDTDQDVYEFKPGARPKRITDEPMLRFADFALDASRQRLICVAERHRKGSHMPDNLLVAIALGGKSRGKVSELVSGRDFYAAPRIAPDGRTLTFVTWDLPDMPWDQAELHVAMLDGTGNAGKSRRVAGGKGIAAAHPRFAPDGTLIFIADENGWGNLSAFDGKDVRALTKLKAEFGRPMWAFASAPYAISENNLIVAAPISEDLGGGFGARILSCTTTGGKKEWHTIAENQLDGLSASDAGVAAFASASDLGSSIRHYSFGDSYHEAIVRTSSDQAFEDVARPELVTFKSRAATARGFYYAPTNSAVTPPRGSKPPALILAHGGPTSMAPRGLSPRIQFYTSRGFAVLDVDYAGSTGYGRAYRERLDGQWGIADVADCAAGARHLAKQGLADADRIAIAGGSAGGYTTLMALATTNVFAAGSSHYGISDLTLLMEHTHKFESGYLHRLLGTTPKSWKKICKERSPLTLIDGIKAPLILFQGLEDKVVPPEQSRLIAEKLKEKGVPVELHEFHGEAHGFRRAETIISVLERELAFLLRAMKIG